MSAATSIMVRARLTGDEWERLRILAIRHEPVHRDRTRPRARNGGGDERERGDGPHA